MAISGTSTDYTGRQLDLYISTTPNLLTNTPPTIYYSFGTPTSYIAGVQKLVQRYVISLMNSGFVEKILASNQSNVLVATHIFNLFSWNVISEFVTYQKTNSLPPDEQLQTVQLLNVSTVPAPGMSGLMLNFSAQLITNAGATVAFILPISLL